MARDDKRTAVRVGLIEAAAHLIASEGDAALTVRRVADEAGTSTMAVYTHFGGMDGLRYAVRQEGFARLGARLAAVDDTDDPVEDLSVLGLAYFTNAIDQPDLYRVMFLHPVHDEIDAEIGWDTFDVLVRGVQRCIDAGRFDAAEATQLATQLWATNHGTVSLHLAGLLSARAAISALGAAALHLIVGYGDDPALAGSSLQRSLDRGGLTPEQDPRVAAADDTDVRPRAGSRRRPISVRR